MDEGALVQGALQGDLDSFNRLVLAYQDMAFNLAMRMLSDTEMAEDVTQTAFISAFRSLKSFRGGSFRAWVMRMVTNACYDELRRRQRHPTTPLEPVDEDDEEIESPSWMADDSPGAEEHLERKELEKAIQRCLKGLDEEFRAVVVMVDLHGLCRRFHRAGQTPRHHQEPAGARAPQTARLSSSFLGTFTPGIPSRI